MGREFIGLDEGVKLTVMAHFSYRRGERTCEPETAHRTQAEAVVRSLAYRIYAVAGGQFVPDSPPFSASILFRLL